MLCISCCGLMHTNALFRTYVLPLLNFSPIQIICFHLCFYLLIGICLQVGSFAGLGFLAWYLAGKIRAFDQRGHIAKLCIVFLPLLIAALVGVSRVDDYWHHWQDVFAGGLLGELIQDLVILFLLSYMLFLLLSYLNLLHRADSCFILLSAILSTTLSH